MIFRLGVHVLAALLNHGFDRWKVARAHSRLEGIDNRTFLPIFRIITFTHLPIMHGLRAPHRVPAPLAHLGQVEGVIERQVLADHLRLQYLRELDFERLEHRDRTAPHQRRHQGAGRGGSLLVLLQDIVTRPLRRPLGHVSVRELLAGGINLAACWPIELEPTAFKNSPRRATTLSARRRESGHGASLFDRRAIYRGLDLA